MSYNQGAILLLPFPFTDQSGTKKRPAIVISTTTYNASHPDVILAPVTSRLLGTPDEVSLNDWQFAGLLKPSAVKPVLSSFDVRLVRRQLGVLSSSDEANVRALFAHILGLP
jgi:mRNA interferase MazF